MRAGFSLSPSSPSRFTLLPHFTYPWRPFRHSRAVLWVTVRTWRFSVSDALFMIRELARGCAGRPCGCDLRKAVSHIDELQMLTRLHSLAVCLPIVLGCAVFHSPQLSVWKQAWLSHSSHHRHRVPQHCAVAHNARKINWLQGWWACNQSIKNVCKWSDCVPDATQSWKWHFLFSFHATFSFAFLWLTRNFL